MNKGKLIAIEGTDCAGKSSIIERLKIQLPILYDIKDYPFIFTREPGNDLTNNKRCLEIRKDLLTNKDLTIQQQTLLLAEARLIHTKDIINAIYNGYINRVYTNMSGYTAHVNISSTNEGVLGPVVIPFFFVPHAYYWNGTYTVTPVLLTGNTQHLQSNN